MKFEMKNPKPMNKNTLRGFFTLAVGPLEIEGFTYHVKNDKSWVGFPAREYFDKETNEKKYWPMIRIKDKDRYFKFQDWATAEAKELLASVPAAEENTTEGSDIPF